METAPHKYAGQYIACVNEEIVASGKTQLEVFKAAKLVHPHKTIHVSYVPTKRETVLFL